MPLAKKLDRTLRAAEDSSDGEDYYEVTDRSSSASVIEADEGGNIISSGDEQDGESEDREMVGSNAHLRNFSANIDQVDASDDEQAKAQMSKVSFGALAKAQDALSKQSTDRKRKRGDDTSKSQEDKLEALRERLRQIKAEKLASGVQPKKKAKTATKTKTKSKVFQDEDSEDKQEAGDDSESDADAAPHARSSKHAPAVQSSKRMVSRKRKVVDVKKPVFRDPRFESVSGPRPEDHVVGSRYAFLNNYRASEISDLRSTIKKTKNEDEKERLKKTLLSMESQQKARENKERLQDVVRTHKKKEKELVKEGKQPFFLKKSEQKKIALVDRFQNMKSKQRDKVIERRRKKVTAKERKNMPDERRTA
jgi:ribosomal RNA-processing protein 36